MRKLIDLLPSPRNQARAHFALPVLRDQTTLAAHALPVAGGGTLSGRTPILWPAP